jgi:hypothetical protein
MNTKPNKYEMNTRTFFNDITERGGAKPPAPMMPPSTQPFCSPSQSLFSLKYKQNIGRPENEN